MTVLIIYFFLCQKFDQRKTDIQGFCVVPHIGGRQKASKKVRRRCEVVVRQ